MAVLTDGFWQRRFGGDPQIVGRTLMLNARAFTVIGVMPPGFSGLSDRADAVDAVRDERRRRRRWPSAATAASRCSRG